MNMKVRENNINLDHHKYPSSFLNILFSIPMITLRPHFYLRPEDAWVEDSI